MKNVFSFLVFVSFLLVSSNLNSQINDSEEEPQLNFDERVDPLKQNNSAYVDNIIS